MASDVGDDCENNWGRDYVDYNGFGRSSTRNKGNEKELNNLIKRVTQNIFHLYSLCATGSQATNYATRVLSFNKKGTICYGIGSYLAGSNSPDQELTTLAFQPGMNLCQITNPSNGKEVTEKAKEVAIPLPYYISQPDRAYENECLTCILNQCRMYKIMGAPILAVVMELMLAGNGARLSTYFLEQLGILGKEFDFNVIFDEIFTCGHACIDHIFLTLTSSYPDSFKNIVSHIILGKWTAVGVVCCKKEFLTLFGTTSNRIDSYSAVSCNQAFRSLEKIIENFEAGQLSNRRTLLINHLLRKVSGVGLSEDSFWGIGLALYGPVSKFCNYGLKHRFLPQLDMQKKISLKQLNYVEKCRTTLWMRPLKHQSNNG